ncbi:MAG: phenylalanine--tRNA ligase subunit beta [Planctomycetota bacterium]
MKISLNWIREFVDLPADAPRTIQDLTTLRVVQAEEVIHQADRLAHMIVVAITAVRRHPKADRLNLVTVDTDTGTIEIVCGAPNVAVGQKVIMARPGAVINGEVLAPAVIRGIESSGMLLSDRELGLSDDHAGLKLLDASLVPGTPAAEALGLDDTIIDIDNHSITHRPDLWCHRGMTREYAAAYGKPLPAELPVTVTPMAGPLKVEIAAPELCRRYTGALVENITIGPSPWPLQRRLLACGIRPISNIVDITNLVMLEVGEPMHAFDADKVRDHRIIVRRAATGESIVTLDGVTRKLGPENLVIADPDKAVALAGVMGGANSEVTAATTRIILEAATFNHVCVRTTRAATGLRSEATNRFEKGLPRELTAVAMNRAIALIKELIPAATVTAVADTGAPAPAERAITLTERNIRRVTGQDITIAYACGILNRLGLATAVKGDTAAVTVPWWRRRDTAIEEDLIEDIVRIHGLEKIVPALPVLPLALAQQPPLRLLEKRLRNILAGTGADEVQTYSFAPEQTLNAFKEAAAEHFELANPLDTNQRRMRRTLLPGLIEGVRRNMPVFPEITIYEIGRVYIPVTRDRERLYDNEKNRLMLLACRKGADTVYYDTLACGQAVLEALNVPFRIERAALPDMHAGRTGALMAGGTRIGWVAELDPAVAAALKLKERIGILELDLEALLPLVTAATVKFIPVPRFPSITREFSMVAPDELEFAAIEDTVRPIDKLITAVEIITVYRGTPIPEGKKSVSFRVILQDLERTLADTEANQVQDRIIAALGKKFGLELRGA